MAKAKNTASILILFLLISSVAAMEFDVGVKPDVRHAALDVQIKQNFSNVFEVNASVRNIGSFECRYRLRADINETKSDQSYKAYSRSAALWPSGIDRLKVYASPKNYTGPIEGNLYIQYCGKEKLVKNFTSKSTSNTTVENTLSLNETSIEERKTEADLNVNETLLVPREYPTFWKVGYANVENFNTTLDYEMPYVNYNRNITYTAFNSSSHEPLGTVKADLQVEEKEEKEKSLLQKVKDNKYKVGLVSSVILNLSLLLLLLRLKGLKLKF